MRILATKYPDPYPKRFSVSRIKPRPIRLTSRISSPLFDATTNISKITIVEDSDVKPSLYLWRRLNLVLIIRPITTGTTTINSSCLNKSMESRLVELTDMIDRIHGITNGETNIETIMMVVPNTTLPFASPTINAEVISEGAAPIISVPIAKFSSSISRLRA